MLWCHCYHIVLDPFLCMFTITLSLGQNTHQYDSNGMVLNRIYQPFVASAFSDIRVGHNPVTLTPGHEIVLRCDMAEYPGAKFTWFRVRQYPIRGKNPPPKRAEEELKPTNDQIVNNNVIVLKSPGYTDVGDYICRVNEPVDEMDKEKTISVRARPYILDFNLDSSTLRSAVVEEGTSLKIPCNASDEYEPDSKLTVKWYTSRYEEDDMTEVIQDEQEMGIRVESLSNTSKTLIIDRVTKDHRRYYKCQVTNGVTDNSKTILIRVKDKYTAIWPAVGIVIEIVILIGVIFIVENRKVEPDKEVYDRKAIQM